MALNNKIGFVGVSKQASKGTAVTPPTFGFGVRGGSILSVALEQPPEELTSTDRLVPSVFRTGVAHSIPFTTRAYPASLGLLYYGVLGAIASAGTTNYTHTITPSNSLPYLTGFTRIDSEYAQVRDCRVDELTISWDSTAPPEIAGNLMGTVLTYGSTWTATNDESTTNILPTAGGTFKFDSDSGTAVVANVAGGSVTIRNNSKPVVLSTSIDPQDVWPGTLEVECTLRLIPDNFNDWRAIVTGTTGGTAVAANPTYGSFDLLFTYDANTSLQLASTKVAFVADYPETSTDGNPAELTVVGTMVKPASGAAITVTAKNQTASY